MNRLATGYSNSDWSARLARAAESIVCFVRDLKAEMTLINTAYLGEEALGRTRGRERVRAVKASLSERHQNATRCC